MVSAKGGKYGFVARSRQRVYKALRKRGYSKEKSARIANAGVTAVQRSSLAKKAAKTRKRRKKK